MKLKTHQLTTPFADLETIIAITRAIHQSDPANVRVAEFVRWVDGLSHAPTDAEFERWCKGKGIAMRGVKR